MICTIAELNLHQSRFSVIGCALRNPSIPWQRVFRGPCYRKDSEANTNYIAGRGRVTNGGKIFSEQYFSSQSNCSGMWGGRARISNGVAFAGFMRLQRKAVRCENGTVERIKSAFFSP